MAFKTAMVTTREDEFEQVALSHLSQLYTAAVFLTKDKTEAEDLLQDTYLRAFRFFDKFQPGTNCRAWLLTVMRNLFYDHYRKTQEDPELVEWDKIDQVYKSLIHQAEKAQTGSPASFLISKTMDDEVDKALKGLPEEFRTAIVLVDIEELSYEETARVMAVPIGTVRTRLFRGRRMLQLALRTYALKRS